MYVQAACIGDLKSYPLAIYIWVHRARHAWWPFMPGCTACLACMVKWAPFSSPTHLIWSCVYNSKCAVVSQNPMRFLCFASRCSSLSYTSFSTRTSQGYGCIYALCLRFRFSASFFLARVTTFWRRDETRNLRKLTHLFVNRIIIAFRSWTDVCAQPHI